MKKLFTVMLCGAIGLSTMIIPMKPISAASATPKIKFSDVSSSYWAKEAINEAVEKGYFKGFPDGTFKPNNSISRGEFAALMARVSVNKEVEGKGGFSDLKGHWSENEVNTAIAKGIIDVKDYTNGFKPNTAMTRYEIAKWMTTALATKDTDYKKALSDTKDTVIPIVEYYKGGIVKSQYPYVSVALGTGLVSGYTDGSFGLEGKATRAEAAAIILRYENVQGKQASDFVGLNELREVGLTGTNITSFTPFRYTKEGMSFKDIVGKNVKMKYDVADIKIHRMIIIDFDENAKNNSIYTPMFFDKLINVTTDYAAMVEMSVTSKKDKLTTGVLMTSTSEQLAGVGHITNNAAIKYGYSHMRGDQTSTYFVKGKEQRLWTTSGISKDDRYHDARLETKDGSRIDLSTLSKYK